MSEQGGEAVEADAGNEPEAPSGEQVEAVAEKPETPAQARARIKVDDQELDDAAYVDLLREALGDDALPNVGSMAKIARTKVSHVGKAEHQIRQAIEDLKDPERVWAVLDRLHPGKVRSMMEARYAQMLEDDSTPPEEKEKRGLKSEIERMRAEKAALEKERHDTARAAQVAELQPQFGREFTAALKVAGADADPETLAEMAKYVEAELDTVHDESTYRALVAEAARAVARRFGEGVAVRAKKLPKATRIEVLRETLREMTYEELRDALGDEGARKFRAGDIAAAKRGNAPPQQGRPTQQANGSKPRERQSLDDFFATIRGGDKL